MRKDMPMVFLKKSATFMSHETSHRPITFIIPGVPPGGSRRDLTGYGRPQPSLDLKGELKASVEVGVRRAGGETHRITATPGEDVVVLHIANGPSLVLHPSSARDLLVAQSGTQRGITINREDEGDHPLELGPNEVEVTPNLRWQGLGMGMGDGRDTTRVSPADVVLKMIDVIGLKDKLQGMAASALADRIDGRVNEGVYPLRREALTALKGERTTTIEAGPAGAPSLVLIHGTFSTTSDSGFARLWSHHPEQVEALFRHYGGRVYALDHATLAATPIDNALTLVNGCSKGAVLHLVTHSRGGLVAEVLSRAAGLETLDEAGQQLFGRWDDQRNKLAQLIDEMREKQIRIERTVRVACPAHGTLLASQRLDAYISILRWAITLAGLPVVPELVDFLGGVARERTDPETLPGLAAMAPNSPLIQWLQKAKQEVPGELRVISGDLKGESARSWAKSLVADAFFWTDNDLVVQTRSMYGGAPRAKGATFVLERSGESSHFNYFTNPRTAHAIVNGLIEANPKGWKVVGPLSFAGQSSQGVRGVKRDGNETTEKAATKPAVILLPGLMGSHLSVDDQRIWLSWRFFHDHQLLAYPNEPDQPEQTVKPDGLIGQTYNALMASLASSHEVIPFSSDWRQPLEEQAKELAKMVEEALKAREASGLPVRLFSHSVGALLARALQIAASHTWNRLMARKGARVLMLAPPNEGLWTPMQMLSGDETLGNIFSAVGGASWRQQMASFPGILQLQAGLLDPSLGLQNHKGWQKLADDDLNQVKARSWWHQGSQQLEAFRWGVPDQTSLNQAVRFWEKLCHQRDADLPSWREKLAIVVGSASSTPQGYEKGAEGIVYLEAPESGDGRVSYTSSWLPDVRTWRVKCEHDKMPSLREAFEAYKELLETGETRELERFDKPTSGARDNKTPKQSWRRVRPSREQGDCPPPNREDDLYALSFEGQGGHGRSAGTPLQITVHNSHLAYVKQPLMLGHYSSSKLTGTEALVNRLIGGTMTEALEIGCYPDLPGTHQVFLNRNIQQGNPLQTARPECAIVVGLGEEGKLSPPELLNSVRMAVLGFAQHWKDRPQGGERPFELWATLLGSGGSGIDAGQAALMIAQGVWAANDLLQRKTHWPVVSSLHLVELYLDRASTALHALNSLEITQTTRFSIKKTVVKGAGWEQRPLDMGYRGAGYDFISALTSESISSGSSNSTIHYTMDTRRARTEMRAQTSQRRLVEQLVAQASNGNNTDRTIGQTLFKLLVPIEMETALGGTSTLVLELDQGSAPIPWELLDTDSGTHQGADHKPWAIRSKLIRKLKMEDFRQQPRDASLSNGVLVIGEPDCKAPRLPGARREARAVEEKLKSVLGDEQVASLIASEERDTTGHKAVEIINKLLERNWRIVHISGHGMLPDGEDPRGVVLSDDLYLGPREIKTMRVVPELVFVNCCHLAATNQERQKEIPYNRAKFAASVAEQLIHNGVRCVVAAGWAVSDQGAELFASRFYDALLRGQRFIDAIATAREAVYASAGDSDNTWAAYQCYGDPDWVLHTDGADPQGAPPKASDPFVGVVSPSALTLALDALSNEARFAKISFRNDATASSSAVNLRNRLEELESRFAKKWSMHGEVAHAFGMAWEQVNDHGKAIQWYTEALKAEDGGATLKSWERLVNLKPRQAWKRVQKADVERQGPKGRLEETDTERQWEKEVSEARRTIQEATESLELLIQRAGSSMERYNLCGAAQKRLAMVERKAGNKDGERKALQQMSDWYKEAEEIGRERDLKDVFYPALNRMAAECVLHAGEESWKGFKAETISKLRTTLEEKSQEDPDFWSEVGRVELELYAALASQNLTSQRPVIMLGYETLHHREKDPMQWNSVQDQLDFVFPVYCERLKASKPQEVEAAQALSDMVRTFTHPI